ncbi:MAG: MAPEG family protein, partial [Rubrivivax sp.]
MKYLVDRSDQHPMLAKLPLARAHANCLEGLPIFGGLMVVAILAGRSSIT